MFDKSFNLLIFCVILKCSSITAQNSSILCNDQVQEFTSETGSITSYNYPNLYGNNLTCLFRIGVHSDEIIIMNFESFATQANRDILRIFDGQNTSSKLIKFYSGSETPARIVSTSNYLFFNFTTDVNISKNGFKLNYKSIKKFLVVDLTESPGIITSAEFPNYYPRGINYTWIISAPSDNLIILEFDNFDIQSTYDVFEIFGVSDNNSTQILANYSGSVKPESLLSNTNQLILNFKTGAFNFGRKGFEISYKFVERDNYLIVHDNSLATQNSTILCDGRVEEFTSENGTIASHNYPDQYENNLKCQFRISVQSNELIIVRFETFSTETSHDVLKVFDGFTSSSRLFGSFSGDDIPPRIVSTSNHIYFNFTTDNNHRENGFKLNYETFKKVSVINLTESEGIIQSPGYPNDYPKGINYTWKISAPANDLIILEFNNFNTENSHDVLQIIDNKRSSNFSGSIKPNRFVSRSNELTLKFKSDNSVESYGFKILYKFLKGDNSTSLTAALNSSILCDGQIQEFTSENGTITSYNYPNDYPDNLNCQFRISARSDEKIIVNFETFSTESNRDILRIYDHMTDLSSKILGSYSGHSTPNRIISSTNYLYFTFITDYNSVGQGFKLNYKSIKVVTVLNLTESEGIIQSPEYPNYYPGNSNYIWNILAPPNKTIILEFIYFETEATHDVLEIIDKNTSMANYSGQVKPDTFFSNTNQLILKFKSDSSVAGDGFKISYKFVEAGNFSYNMSLTSINSSINCGERIQEFRAESGTITSNNYPNQYKNNLNCLFRISVKPDEIIIVNFETFATQPMRDILKIYEGAHYSSSSLLNSFSGNDLPTRVVSSSNYLYFTFSTDSSEVGNGFKFNYKSSKKVSVIYLTESEGIIQSPEYPNNYTQGISYTWKISAPDSNLIILEFNDFNTEATHDILKIFGVVDGQNTSLANYSGSDKPDSLLSYTNEVILIFRSDSSVQRKGFEISYKFVKIGADPKYLVQTPYSFVSAGFDGNPLTNIDESFDIQHWYYEEHFTNWELFHQYSNKFEMSMVTLSMDKTEPVKYMAYYNSYLKQLNVMSNNSLDIIEDDIKSIAFVSNNNLLIWTDIQNKFIKICKISETKTEYIFNNSIEFITNQMLINEEKSVLIWTVLGHNPRIVETNFDGSNQSVIYNNSKQVSHLTIDYENQRYYFIDIKDYTLYSIDFSGENETFYMRSEDLFHINNMFVWNNNLYLSNKQLVYKIPRIDLKIMKAEILYYSYDYYKMERDFKIESKVFFKRNSYVIIRYDFQSIIPLEYKNSSSNQCSSNQCSHLCLPMPNGYRCVCPSNYISVSKTECLEIKEEPTVQTTSQLDEISSTKPYEIYHEQNDLKPNEKIQNIHNESLEDHIDSNDLTAKLLELENKLRLEFSSNSNKFSITNFILILIIVAFNALILYYFYKKTKSNEKFYDKRKESKIPLIVLNNDSENDNINVENENSLDNKTFSNC